MKAYAEHVVEHLVKFPAFSEFAESINGIDILGVDRFADGEMEAVVRDSIRGKDVVLFTTSCARNEADISVEEAKIELYHTIDALKRCQPATIIVFEPFVSCSRSDRTARRSSVGLWIHLKTLSSLGAEHIVTYQMHSDKSKSMVDPVICSIDDIPAVTLLQRYLCDTYIHTMDVLETEVRNSWAFCSVDAGGEQMARGFANAFGAPLVVAHKQRDYTKTNTVESVNILSAEPIKGKKIWIVDDMIDTGGSVCQLVEALAKLEPAEVNIMAVHPVLSNPASEKLTKLYNRGLLKKIVVTDSVCCLKKLAIPCLEVVSSAELSAKIIRTIETNKAMGKLLREFDVRTYLEKISSLLIF
jgi:ribose-phosphate pyrophosphokinase